MSTVIIPRSNVTVEEVSGVLRDKLGSHCKVTPFAASNLHHETSGYAGSILVKRNWLERANIRILPGADCTENLMMQMTLGSGGQKIEARHLTKRIYGSTLAVDDLSFDVNPGIVTGFIGPNGSGKTTTMRLILGLDGPTSGEVTVGGRLYRDLPAPLREVGALIDAKAVHPSRTAYHYLLALAQSNAIAASRVDEVLGLVGMEGVAGKRVGGFSLGMGQRLGIAGALLGDPPVLMFDEPLNGLDPEGIVWIRQLMRHLAGEGRTVFVSSHLMNEMAVTADHLIVIGQGKLLRDEGMSEFIESTFATLGSGALPPTQRAHHPARGGRGESETRHRRQH
jgi:ABC-type multidrug transport system ATPase subunit